MLLCNFFLFFFMQVCSAGSRLIVQESVADRMVKKIKERMTHLRLGDSLDKVNLWEITASPVKRYSLVILWIIFCVI